MKVNVYCAALVLVGIVPENSCAIDFIGYRHVDLKTAVVFCAFNLFKDGLWVNVRLLAFYCKSNDGKPVSTTNQNVVSFKHRNCEGRSKQSQAYECIEITRDWIGYTFNVLLQNWLLILMHKWEVVFLLCSCCLTYYKYKYIFKIKPILLDINSEACVKSVCIRLYLLSSAA